MYLTAYRYLILANIAAISKVNYHLAVSSTKNHEMDHLSKAITITNGTIVLINAIIITITTATPNTAFDKIATNELTRR